MMRLWVVLVASAVVGFAPAPFLNRKQTPNQDDFLLLQGKWKLIEYRNNGVRTKTEGTGARLKGKTWTFLFGKRKGPWYTLHLDQTVSPRMFRWGDDEVETDVFGIYKIEGRRLTMVRFLGSRQDFLERPPDFSGRTGHFYVYERE